MGRVGENRGTASFEFDRATLLIVALVLVILAVPPLVMPGEWLRKAFFAEAGWQVLLASLLSSYRPLRACFARLPEWRRFLLLGLALLFLLGQFLGDDRQLYPFVRWAMYTEPRAQAQSYSYEGMLVSGERVVVEPTQLIPSLRGGRFESRARQAGLGEAGGPVGSSRELEEILHSLMVIYNHGHPENPIQELSVHRFVLSDDTSLERHTLLQLDLDGADAR